MTGAAAPALLCALAVSVLLVAEYRDLRPGMWLAKPLASAAFVWAGLASGALASGFGRLTLVGLLLCLIGDGPPAVAVGALAFSASNVAERNHQDPVVADAAG